MLRIGRLLARSRKNLFIRNNDIIFDRVKVIDDKGAVLGVMTTREGIALANIKGFDLVLVDYNAEPPVCQLSKEGIEEAAHATLDDTDGFSFDPTLRPAIIQVSSTIDAAELERKVDILRKHLLEKKRCEIVVTNRDNRSDAEDIHDLLGKIIREVEDIAKSPDAHNLELVDQKVSLRIWPCNPDQVSQADWSSVEIEGSEPYEDNTSELRHRGHPRKFRYIRRRVDPKMLGLGKDPKPVDE